MTRSVAVFDYPEPIPTELAARWTGSHPDRVVLLDLLLVWVLAGAVGLGVLAGVALVVTPSAAAAGLVALAGLAGLLAVLVRHGLRRRRVLWPAREIDLVVTHRRLLVLPAEADGVEEFRLAERARRCAADLVALPGWAAGDLDDQRLLLDPDEEAREIAVAAAALHERRHRVGSVAQGVDTAPADLVLAESIAALRTRVEAFEALGLRVAALAGQLERRRRATELALLTDVVAADLATATARHELATRRLEQLAATVLLDVDVEAVGDAAPAEVGRDTTPPAADPARPGEAP